MPPRPNKLHTRSPERQRVWGSRYETLVSPPPQEKLQTPAPPTPESPTPRDEAVRAHTSSDDFPTGGRPSERRDWADDEVPLNMSPRSRTVSSTIGGTPRQERQPHNASVFVGRYASINPFCDSLQFLHIANLRWLSQPPTRCGRGRDRAAIA